MSAIQQVVASIKGGKSLSSATASTFNAVEGRTPSISKIDATRMLIVFRDYGNSEYVTGVVATLSGTTITYGSKTVISTTTNTDPVDACVLPGTSYGVVAFTGAGGSLMAKMISISGSTITLGSDVTVIGSGQGYVSVSALDSGKVILAYTDSGGTTYGYARVLTAAWPSMTVAGAATFQAAFALLNQITALSATTAVVTYLNGGNSSYLTVCAMTISGTAVTTGSNHVVKSASVDGLAIIPVSGTSAVILSGRNASVAARALSVSGTTITQGSELAISGNSSNKISGCALSSTEILATWSDGSNSGRGTVGAISVAGTTLSNVGNPIVFESSAVDAMDMVPMSQTLGVVAYRGAPSKSVAIEFK